MATTPLSPIVSAVSLGTSYTTIYTVASGIDRAGIDAVVFNNYSPTTVTISVRIIQSGVGGDLNEIITEKSIRAKQNDLGAAMIGQALSTGGTIQAKASAIDSVNANITATEIST